jgi:UDP-N-acetylmuramoyl-tripeptide--D-alanyl-D-alanine ligase
MKTLTLGEIEKATRGKCIKGNKNEGIIGVCADSRKGKPGFLFFALPGEHNDGHEFLESAKLSGCIGAVISRETKDFPMDNCIMVDDTLKALQELSLYFLETFSIKKVAITGSTGKTTTKDMVAAICETKFKTAKTQGNYNNHIGLPLTILSMDEGTEVGIFEMGMDKPGEIQFLASLVKPDIGIITNVGYSHLEKLGSRENILKAKLEVVTYFNEGNTLIINADGDFLTEEVAKGNYKTIVAGTNKASDYKVSNIRDDEEGISFDLELAGEKHGVMLAIHGSHNALNAGLALACGRELGISIEDGLSGLGDLVLTEKRLEISQKDNIKVIDDTYNASPDSVKSAIDVLIAQKGQRKIAILGDMFELGEETEKYHYEIGKYAGEIGVDVVVTVGDLAYNIALGAREYLLEELVLSYANREAFLPEVQSLIRSGDVVLVKASRGMQLEEIVKEILD